MKIHFVMFIRNINLLFKIRIPVDDGERKL